MLYELLSALATWITLPQRAASPYNLKTHLVPRLNLPYPQVAVSLSELLSAYPTSGGIYYWVWALAPHRWRTLLCWMCGWVAVLGQVSFIAANGSILVNLVRICLLMATGRYRNLWRWPGVSIAGVGERFEGRGAWR